MNTKRSQLVTKGYLPKIFMSGYFDAMFFALQRGNWNEFELLGEL